jgi:hypothetical protein
MEAGASNRQLSRMLLQCQWNVDSQNIRWKTSLRWKWNWQVLEVSEWGSSGRTASGHGLCYRTIEAGFPTEPSVFQLRIFCLPQRCGSGNTCGKRRCVIGICLPPFRGRCWFHVRWSSLVHLASYPVNMRSSVLGGWGGGSARSGTLRNHLLLFQNVLSRTLFYIPNTGHWNILSSDKTGNAHCIT